MRELAIAIAAAIYAEARTRAAGDIDKLATTVLSLLKEHTNDVDNYLAYQHWDDVTDGRSALKEFLFDGPSEK
jgi:hypothetical protein